MPALEHLRVPGVDSSNLSLRSFAPGSLASLLHCLCGTVRGYAGFARIATIAFILVTFTSAAFGTDYYVSTLGNNNDAGTVLAPWRTIQKAATTATAGDNVFIRGGVYTERVTITGKPGTALQPIVFSSFTGEQAIVDQNGVTPPDGTSALLHIHNSNHVIIRGIEFRNYKTPDEAKTPIGIHITGACDGVRLEQNSVHGIWQSNAEIENFEANAHGILAYGNAATPINHLVIDGNEVYDLRLGASEALVLNGNVTNFQVLRNVVHDCNNLGIDFIGFEGTASPESLDQARNGLCALNEVYNIDTQFNPAYGGNFNGAFPSNEARNNTRAAAGIYVDGGKDIIIERNHVHHCNFGVEVASEHGGKLASGIIVRNNLFRANHVGGVFMGGADSGNGGIDNCSFTHNTIYQNDAAAGFGGQVCIQHHVTNTAIRHNIIVSNSSTDQFVLYEASDGAGITIDWNLYSGSPAVGMDFIWEGTETGTFANWQGVSGQDSHSVVVADPGFVDAAGNDFNLLPAASAVNAGDPVFSKAPGELDFGGLDRLVDGRVDIGMDEFGEGGAVVQFDQVAYPAVAENAGPIVARLVRTGDTTTAFDVTFSSGSIGDTAVPGTDYTSHPGTSVHFDAGQLEATVPVPLIDRPGVQGSRLLTVTLSAPTAGASLGATAIATATIKDAAGTIALDLLPASTIDVNENAGSLQIPVVRTGGADGVVGFSITTASGSALAGSDFKVPTKLQSLGNGVTVLNVPVTILSSAALEPEETFTVTISAPTGGATLGAVVSVTVRIVDVDITAPSIAIAKPLVNSVHGVASGGVVSVKGTATDNKGVDSVKVKLNNGSLVNATLSAPGATSTPWSLDVVPANWVNTVTVQAFDERGNGSLPATRSFFVTRPLKVSLDDDLGAVSPGFTPSSDRRVGLSLTVSATPKAPAGIFTGWTIGGQDVEGGGGPFTPQRLGIVASALQKQSLTFIFREGLELTAEFAPNPFVPAAGIYHGLIRPSGTHPDRSGTQPDGTARTNATEGGFTATVQNSGAFSATLVIDGMSATFNGAFDLNGDARFGTARLLQQTVARKGKPSLIVELRLAAGKVMGTVTAFAFQQSIETDVSKVESERAYYNGLTPATTVDSDYLGTVPNTAGTFSVIFPPEPSGTQTIGYSKRDYPQGFGTGRITVSKAGAVSLSGTMADGAVITASSALSEGNTFPLFAQLYNKQGFVSGMVLLNKLDPDSDLSATDLFWLRPFQGTSHYYPHGWSIPIKVDMMAAKYVATTVQSIIRRPGGAALPAAHPDGNVALHFAQGQLSDPLVKTANVSATDGVIKVPSNDPTFTLSIDRGKASFTGLFDHTDDTRIPFNGVIYQKGAFAGGYGYFLTKLPAPITYTGESGEVRLIAPP